MIPQDKLDERYEQRRREALGDDTPPRWDDVVDAVLALAADLSFRHMMGLGDALWSVTNRLRRDAEDRSGRFRHD